LWWLRSCQPQTGRAADALATPIRLFRVLSREWGMVLYGLHCWRNADGKRS